MPSLTVGGLSLPLVEYPDGPLLASDGVPWAPLAWVANAALEGSLPQAGPALERGEGFATQGFHMARPGPADDLSGLRARWREWTGQDAGDDVYVLGAAFAPERTLVPRAFLREVIERLEEMRRPPDPGPPGEPLFLHGSPGRVPAPGEEAMLRELESDATALESAGEGPATSARRDALLAQIAGCGLLDEDGAAERRVWLDRWGLGTLAGYQSAALRLLDYYRSPQRARYLEHPDAPPVVGGPVSLDWFRKAVPTPPTDHPYEWTAYYEVMLRTSSVPQEIAGDLLVKQRGMWHRLWWRREGAGNVALVRAGKLE